MNVELEEEIKKDDEITTNDDSSSLTQGASSPNSTKYESHFTVRSVVVGVLVGGLMCFSNMYFGLQTGWVTMGSLQSTLLGFGFFKLLQKRFSLFSKFSPIENVLLQTTAVATATMPLAGGFVGIIPALGMLNTSDNPGGKIDLSWWKLILWATSMCFFGVFFAVPLRKQTILREKLKFPSGTATAKMISVLHKIPNGEKETFDDEKEWKKKWKILFISFAISSVYSIFSFFFPILGNLPIFTWFGAPSLTAWNWTITPSFSYIGQGMIMGAHTGISMLLGLVIGWAILGPIAKWKGWAPNEDINSWEDGAKGYFISFNLNISWLLWISLAIMMSESLFSLGIVVVKMFIKWRKKTQENIEDNVPLEQQVPMKWWIGGLIVTSVICVAIISPLFHIWIYEPIIALLVALLVSVLAVRALGETDLNPVSGVGKVSQLVFAVVAPGNVVSNLVAGAIAEAGLCSISSHNRIGAQQAGDLMQDLKTGHLIGASPRSQFFGQLIGSFCSIFFSVAAYQLYTSAYSFPSSVFPVPTAGVWIDMARLVNGGKLATNVGWFCILGAIAAGILPILVEWRPRWKSFIPSGLAFAIALYVTPNWSIPRIVGSVIQLVWQKRWTNSFTKYSIIVASGFVLGEGITSIFTAIMKSAGVPTYS